jgi:predicted dehydrogenase
MSKKIAVIGAGSIGNHLAFSCRKVGWSVSVFDIDKKALDRFKTEIYPSRYGNFDNSITLETISEFTNYPEEYFDAVLIGTPPEFHSEIAAQATKLKPKVILIEKPITGPNKKDLTDLKDLVEENSHITYLCGYNHKVNLATLTASQLVNRIKNDKNINLEVLWQESWDGILKAHPWLEDQNASYLGYSSRGGGAMFEHSHGLDLWLHMARLLDFGNVTSVKANALFQKDGNGNNQYDESIKIEISTESGNPGLVVQDVVTSPAIKTITVKTDSHVLSFGFNDVELGDFVILKEVNTGNEILKMRIAKTRPFDFDLEINEISNIFNLLDSGEHVESILSANYAIYTAQIATASLDSATDQKPHSINR